MSKNNSAQVALEFLIIMGLVIAVFVGFLYLLNQQITEIGLNEDRVAAKNLGEAIRNEVLLARQVHANYIRRFPIPEKLNGKNYSITLLEYLGGVLKHSIMINVSGEVEYFTLPVDIKGQFVEVKENFTDYCVTKGKTGEVAISRNQVGLEYAQIYDGAEWRDVVSSDKVNGVLEIGQGDKFSLYLTANCINNFQTASFDINHEGFSYEDFRQAWDHNDVTEPAPYQIYGDFMFEGDDLDNIAFLDKESCGTDCTRITISHAGLNGPTGYDALVELVFEAGTDTELKIIKIENVSLVDAQIRDIPPSKQDIEVIIIT